METFKGVTLEVSVDVFGKHDVPATCEHALVDFSYRCGWPDRHFLRSRAQVKKEIIGPGLLTIEISLHPVDVHADIEVAHQLPVCFIEVRLILSQLT
jgi:hypothetical protein